MEGRPPPEGDELFEWTDSPARPAWPREPAGGEEEDPLATGERGAVRDRRRERGRRSDTEERRRVGAGAGRRPARGDTGEFERGGREPPQGRRARHRDLPARVRRRQATIIGVVAVALLIALIVAVSGGGGGHAPSIGLKRLVGQTIVAKLGKGGPDQALLQRIRQGRVGALIAFPKSAQTLTAGIRQAQTAAVEGGNPPLLVMIDQEGGDVKRLPQGPPDSSPQQLGRSGDEDASRSQGQKTGSYLKGLGVNVDLAPVLDIAHPQTAADIRSRTFGNNPDTVSTVGVAFGQGLEDGGVLAAPKHFPGLGRATVTTDRAAVSVAATTQQLQGDLAPFKSAIDAGLPLMMVSTASYPNLGSKQPAALSATIVKDLLRGRLGFDGVVTTDDLESPAVGSSTAAAANALRAGVDLLLFAKSDAASDRAFKSVVAEVKRHQLQRSAVASAYGRITSLKGDLP